MKWDCRARKWVPLDSPPLPGRGYSNMASFRTYRRALKCARGLVNRAGQSCPPCSVTVTRHLVKHGRVWCQDFFIPVEARG